MEIRSHWKESIDKRKSRRSYIQKNISDLDILTIVKLIDEINKASELNIQFIKNGQECINGFKASYGMISGVNSFIALVGNKDIKNYKEKLGYYGEMIVLEATSLGLSTCWVGGTYDKKACASHLKTNENEELVCIIVLGYSPTELTVKEKVVKTLNKKSKKFEDLLINNNNTIKNWVKTGIECALKAPSALNKQEIVYVLNENKVNANITKRNYGYEEVDLGISMLHFEIGAHSENHKGSWNHENGGYSFY